MTTTLHWNGVLLELSRRDHSQGYAGGAQAGPTRTSRAMAMTHLAIYNAIAAVKQPTALYTRSAKGGQIVIPIPATKSLPQLIDGAAHTMLMHLYGRQKQYIDISAMTSTKDAGFIAGKLIADVIIEDRLKDGSGALNPPAPPSDATDPAKHRTDPFEPGQPALGKEWGSVKRFCGDTNIPIGIYPGSGAVPLLSDDDFRKDYLEVLDKGARGRTTRTPDETAIGVFWAYDGANNIGVPPRLYNQIARVVIDKRIEAGPLAPDPELAELEIARLLATVNCAMADAGIDAWLAKYINNLWRPVVGIRSEGGGDPFWAPIGAPQTNRPGIGPRTPPFPAYPSGHATFGAALFQVLAKWHGAEIKLADVLNEETGKATIADQTFTFVSDELDGIATDTDGSMRTRAPRTFQSYARAVYENAISRVYLGVHWRFDGLPRTDRNIGGVPLGLKVGLEAHKLFDDLSKAPTVAAKSAKSNKG